MRTIHVVVASVLLLSACAGPSAPDVVAEASRNLGSLRGGLLELRVELFETEASRPTAGVAVLGSFERTDLGELPLGDLTVDDLAPRFASSFRVVSTAEAAFVRVDGTFYEVSPERLDPMGTARDGETLFARVSIADWVRDPQLSSGEGLDGRPVDRIEGDLVVEEAFDDLLTIVSRLPAGGPLPVLGHLDPGSLSESAEPATIEIVAGSNDRQIRRISMVLELDPDAPISSRPEWEGAARLAVDLGISEPNRRLRIEPPRRSPPGSRLEGNWP